MLTLENIAIDRGERTLVRAVNLRLTPGQRLGIVGANGCGKSSLLAVIRGELEPETGSLALPASWRVASIRQHSPSGPQTALDYVLDGHRELRALEQAISQANDTDDGTQLANLHQQYEQIHGYAARAQGARLLAGLGFSDSAQQHALDTFSGGWRGRLNLARALFQPSEILLLDEPTNHLDLESVGWLQGWLQSYPGVMLVVSHDRDFLDQITTHTAWFEQGAVEFMAGHYSQCEDKRAQRQAQQQAQYRKEQAQAGQLQAFIDRFRAKASKAKQAQSRLKMLQRLSAAAPAHERSGYRFQFPQPERTGTPLLSLDRVVAGYPGNIVLDGVSRSILPGDRIGLLGRNGAGKSTLIDLLRGQLTPLSGARVAGAHLKIGHFAQHQVDQLRFDRSPLEHLLELRPDEREQSIRDFAGSFGFHGDHACEPIAPRSGGEKARLALALLAWRRPNLLLLDEPTNHLDLAMRHALAVALQDFAGALVLVSHDRSLLSTCCDDLWVVGDGRIRQWEGDIDSYLQQRPKADPSRPAANEKDGRRSQRQVAARERQRLQPLRQRVQIIEKQMTEVQTRLDRVRGQLADPKLYQQQQAQDLVTTLNSEASGLQKTLSQCESEWLTASEALEAAMGNQP